MQRIEPISDQLRRAIRESEKTAYRISKETGVAASILSRFLNGQMGISLDTIDKIGVCLGLRLVAEQPTKKRKG